MNAKPPRTGHRAVHSHDHHQVAALCTDDIEWHDPSLPGPGHGADVIAGLMETLVRACPDFRFEETEPAYRSLAQPKTIAPWRFTGTMTGSLVPPGFAPTCRRVEIPRRRSLGLPGRSGLPLRGGV